MPMFDDPRKELQRLQQELLAEEEELEPEFLDEDDWLERELAEAKALSGYQEPPQPQVRNYANGYGAKQPASREMPPQQRTYMSGYSAYREERPDYRGNMDRYDEEIEEEENSIRGLVALACLLTAGILGVALYWVFVLL